MSLPPLLSLPRLLESFVALQRIVKTGDASHLHWMMPDECSFFCSKAGEKHCSIFIAVLWKCPQATVPLERHDDTMPVPRNMQSALGYSPSLWCSQNKLSRRSRQSLTIDLQQARQQALMSFIFLVSPCSMKVCGERNVIDWQKLRFCRCLL